MILLTLNCILIVLLGTPLEGAFFLQTIEVRVDCVNLTMKMSMSFGVNHSRDCSVRLVIDLFTSDFVVTTFVPLDGTVPIFLLLKLELIVVLLLSFAVYNPECWISLFFVEEDFVFHSSHAWDLVGARIIHDRCEPCS
jgi:hypothetical protein